MRFHGGYVYFQGKGLQRVPIRGGPLETIAAHGASDLVVDGEGLYCAWSRGLWQLVWSEGEARVLIPTASPAASGVAVDERTLFWATPSNGTIQRMDKWPGGIPENDYGW